MAFLFRFNTDLLEDNENMIICKSGWGMSKNLSNDNDVLTIWNRYPDAQKVFNYWLGVWLNLNKFSASLK